MTIPVYKTAALFLVVSSLSGKAWAQDVTPEPSSAEDPLRLFIEAARAEIAPRVDPGGRSLPPTAAAALAPDMDPSQFDLLLQDPQVRSAISRLQKNSAWRKKGRGERIYFGSETADYEFVVSLVHERDDGTQDFVCTGSHIGDGLVLTAAHCLCDRWKKPQDINVVKFIRGKDWRSPHYFNVVSIAALPGRPSKFCRSSQHGQDAALLFLGDAVEEDSFPAQPVPASWEPLDQKEEVIVVGYGLNEFGDAESYAFWQYNKYSRARRMTELLIASTDCRSMVGIIAEQEMYKCVPDKELVAADLLSFKRDACHGDSGGPLLVGREDDFRLVGIVARRLNDRCGSGTIFSRLSGETLDWVHNCSKKLRGGAAC